MSDNSCVVVCVTQQPGCGRLIRAGKKIADNLGLCLQVLNIQPEQNCFAPNPEAMENLYRQSKEAKANMAVYFNNDPALVAAGHARKIGAVTMVVGFPAEHTSSFIADVHMLLPSLPICMVDQDDKIYHMMMESTVIPQAKAVQV